MAATCKLIRPAPQTLWDRVSAMFSANVLGGAPIIRNSTEQFVVGNDYLAQETYYSIAEQMWKEADPRNCCCDNLVAMAARRKLYPRPATFAVGYVTLTGTPGSGLSPTMQFQIGGNTYRADTATNIPSVIPSSGSCVVRVVALTPGSAGNSINGAVSGSLVTPLSGVSATITPCGAQFCNGREAETCEQFRSRYIARGAYRTRGRFDDLAAAIMQFPCVTRVCLRNCSCCTRQYSFELYAMFDGTFPNGIAPANVIDDLQHWFFGSTQGMGLGEAPAQVYGNFFVPTAAAVDVVVDGLQCLRSDQIQIVRDRIADLFLRHCPSDTLCTRQFELAIAQVTGDACNFFVSVTPAAGATGITISDCGDVVPDCDVLPVLGSITIPTQVC